MAEKLSPMQQRVCAEYLIDLNATQAAIRAGYSPGKDNASAQVSGSRLLSTAMVQSAIAIQHRQRLSKAGLRVEDVVRELRSIAFSDIRQLVDHDNQPVSLRSLPDDVASSVSAVSVETDGRGGTRTRLKTWDKTVALRMLIDRLLPAVQAHVHLSPEDLARLSDGDLDKVETANRLLMEVSSTLEPASNRSV